MKKLMVLYLAAFLLSCGMSFPQEGPEVKTRFTEIIIKVEPDVIAMPEGVYKTAIDNIKISSRRLKELNKKFNLISIEKMFVKKKSEEEVAKEFPEREARAPEEREEPELENTFLLKFPEHTDIKEIIDRYEEIEEIIYAEENIKVGIF